MTNSDSPRRLAFGLPSKLDSQGNETSSVVLDIGGTTFQCAKKIDGITLLEFAQIASAYDPEAIERGEEPEMTPAQAAESSGAILNLLKSTIKEWDRFREFVAKNEIEIEDLSVYASKLVEAYTARPTQLPSES